jgi:hypothetical protein
MAAWVANVRSDLLLVLPLLAAAGPKSITLIEVLRPGTVRGFAAAVLCLMVLHVIGLGMLVTVRADERQPKAHWLGMFPLLGAGHRNRLRDRTIHHQRHRSAARAPVSEPS